MAHLDLARHLQEVSSGGTTSGSETRKQREFHTPSFPRVPCQFNSTAAPRLQPGAAVLRNAPRSREVPGAGAPRLRRKSCRTVGASTNFVVRQTCPGTDCERCLALPACCVFPYGGTRCLHHAYVRRRSCTKDAARCPYRFRTGRTWCFASPGSDQSLRRSMIDEGLPMVRREEPSRAILTTRAADLRRGGRAR